MSDTMKPVLGELKPARGADAYDPKTKTRIKVTGETSKKVAHRAVFPERGINIDNWPPKNWLG